MILRKPRSALPGKRISMAGWRWWRRSGTALPAWKRPRRWRITETPVWNASAGNPPSARALLFSRDQGELCFLAVAPECRRQHIARELFTFMLTRMELGRDISVTTYRTGDPRGAAARAFYQKMGFAEGPLSEAFGCPVQEFLRKG